MDGARISDDVAVSVPLHGVARGPKPLVPVEICLLVERTVVPPGVDLDDDPGASPHEVDGPDEAVRTGDHSLALREGKGIGANELEEQRLRVRPSRPVLRPVLHQDLAGERGAAATSLREHEENGGFLREGHSPTSEGVVVDHLHLPGVVRVSIPKPWVRVAAKVEERASCGRCGEPVDDRDVLRRKPPRLNEATDLQPVVIRASGEQLDVVKGSEGIELTESSGGSEPEHGSVAGQVECGATTTPKVEGVVA